MAREGLRSPRDLNKSLLDRCTKREADSYVWRCFVSQLDAHVLYQFLRRGRNDGVIDGAVISAFRAESGLGGGNDVGICLLEDRAELRLQLLGWDLEIRTEYPRATEVSGPGNGCEDWFTVT